MPTFSANDLRKLAERADSHRGKRVFLIRMPEGSPAPFDITENRSGGEPDVLLEMQTDSVPAFVPRQRKLTLQSDPIVTVEGFPGFTIDNCDAVFTTPAAMDKFLVPYYSTFTSRPDIDRMVSKFATDPSALAACHLPDSIESLLRAQSGDPLVQNSPSSAGMVFIKHDEQQGKAKLLGLQAFLDS